MKISLQSTGDHRDSQGLPELKEGIRSVELSLQQPVRAATIRSAFLQIVSERVNLEKTIRNLHSLPQPDVEGNNNRREHRSNPDTLAMNDDAVRTTIGSINTLMFSR